MEFLADSARINYELKQQELKMLKEQQALERENMEAVAKQQLQTQQQPTEMFKVLQQQQQQQQQQSQQQLVNTQMMMMQQQQQEQSTAMMALLEKLTNKWSMDLCQKSGLQHILLHCISFPSNNYVQ